MLFRSSKKDIGSSFIFEIDLKQIDDKEIEIEIKKEFPLKNDNSYLKDKKILLVEDNFTNQLVILGLLEDCTLNIDVAKNGQEAVDKFKENKYELILMYLQMPVMDGYEATEIIRELDADIPIIALTANVMKEDIERTKAVGMNEHLHKPVDINKLFSILHQYIK